MSGWFVEESSVQDLVVIGAGGHAREIVSLVRDINRSMSSFNLLGVMADDPPDEEVLGRLGVAYLGPVPSGGRFAPGFVVGIGASSARQRVAEHLASLGGQPVTLVHPSAQMGIDVELAPGVVVFAGVVLTTNIRIGLHSHLNVSCSVSHDCRVGAYVTVSPGAVVCGNVTLGTGAYVGANACIIQGLDVDERAVVGAGAVVTRNVAADLTVAGVPARLLRDSTLLESNRRP